MRKWFNSITLGQPKRFLKIAGWLFLDNYIATIPYGVMLGATWFLLTPLAQPSASLPVRELFTLCLLLLAQTVLYYFVARRSYMFTCTGFGQIIRQARINMGERLRQLPMGFYNSRDVGDLSTVLLRDYDTVEGNASEILPLFAGIAARFTLALVVLAVFDWRMMLVTIAVIPMCIPFAVISYRSLGKKNLNLLTAQQQNTSRILEYVGGIQTLKAFNQGETMFARLKSSCEELRRQSISVEVSSAPLGLVGRVLLNCGTALVLYFGTRFLLLGSLSPWYFIVFLLIALNLYEPLMNLFYYLVNITRLNHCAGRIDEVFAAPCLPYSRTETPENVSIAFDNVTFGYGDKTVLRNISFAIPPKSMTALVGPSGSGKSTVTRLIARFWDVQGGQITLGGVPLHTLHPDTILEKVSIVFQDVYLFHDTIEANIRMGRPDAGMEEIVQAAKQAACHDFIAALPDGYQTMVGEHGSTLSGGEKQRISIARALLKDAPIVLLDEATASLDPENEVLIGQAINELVADKTVVVIAHRLQSICCADQIIVLEEGRVSASGTHESLLAQEGVYRRMWQEQQEAAAWFLTR